MTTAGSILLAPVRPSRIGFLTSELKHAWRISITFQRRQLIRALTPSNGSLSISVTVNSYSGACKEMSRVFTKVFAGLVGSRRLVLWVEIRQFPSIHSFGPKDHQSRNGIAELFRSRKCFLLTSAAEVVVFV